VSVDTVTECQKAPSLAGTAMSGNREPFVKTTASLKENALGGRYAFESCRMGCDSVSIEASFREQAVAKSIHPEICFCQDAGVSERKVEEKLFGK